MENRIRSQSKPSAGGGAYAKDNGHAGLTNSSDDAVTKAATGAVEATVSDIKSLRADMNGLRDTLADFISHASREAAETARDAAVDFAGQVSGAAASVVGQVSGIAGEIAGRGAEMAAAASNQAKTIASEIEGIARRNPIGAMAGALLIGVLIGMAGRKRL